MKDNFTDKVLFLIWVIITTASLTMAIVTIYLNS